MSQQELAVVKMPENLKALPLEVSEVDAGRSGIFEFRNMSASFSVNWVLIGTSVAGYAFIPDSTGFFGIPITLNVISAFIAVSHAFLFFGEEIPAAIRYELANPNAAKKNRKEISSSFTLKHEGVKLSSWKRSVGSGIAHFLLPLRVFKRVKMSESVTYFPQADKYVKETQYLGFRRWIKIEEPFEGHRAVFQKAINSF
jgi:hypothetical protein